MKKDDRRMSFKDRRKLYIFEKIVWILLWAIVAASLLVIAYQDYTAGN